MQDFAAGSPMSTRLRTEITAYQLCPLDDTAAESPHAHVSMTVKSKVASKPAQWSAKLRWEQNKALRTTVENMKLGAFHRCFTGWKSIVQRDLRKSNALIPAAITPSYAKDIVYRMGHCAIADWSVFRKFVTGQKSFKCIKPNSLMAMKVEYIGFLLTPGGIYSVPGDNGFASLGSDPLNESNAPPKLFQLVSFNAVRMDHVHTISMMKMKSWRKLGVLQMLDIAPTAEDSPEEHLDVFPLGTPRPVDLVLEYSWEDWTQKLLSWSVDSSRLAGCFRITSPMPAQSTWTEGGTNASILCARVFSCIIVRIASYSPKGTSMTRTQTCRHWQSFSGF